jgi:dolichol-phosphate mannosyltransferase
VSVVIPVGGDAARLPGLLDRLAAVRAEHALDLEAIVVDGGGDGVAALVEARSTPWVRRLEQGAARGFGAAAVVGLRSARREAVLVMRADGQHPPERIPDLLAALAGGSDFAIAVRAAPAAGGGAAGLRRRLERRAAALLARPFTRTTDPLSGFFALGRAAAARAEPLEPAGRAIALELLVKTRAARVAELPIVPGGAGAGAGLEDRLRYLQHLRRLLIHRWPDLASLSQFLVVGAVGVVVNLAALTALLALGAPVRAAVALAIAVSMLSNFALNRRFTFSYARRGSVWRQLAGFVLSCSLGAAVNYGMALWCLAAFPAVPAQGAALAGIVAGTGLNFLTSRYLVFRGPTAPRRAP